MNIPSTSEALAENLRELHRQASSEPPGGHLETEQIEAASLGGQTWSSLDDTQRDTIVDHLASCVRCADIVRELRSLRPWAEDVQHARQIGRFARSRRVIMPIAAALAIAVLGLVFWNAPEDTPIDIARGGTNVLAPADDAELTQAPTELTWPAQSGASGYRVELLDQHAQPIWRSQVVTDQRLEFDRATRDLLATGGAYAWTVEVDGTPARSRLGPYWFTIGE